MKASDLKIRASAIGNIMHFDSATQLTEKQAEQLNVLLAKIQLTEKQADERNRLIEKRDAKPGLSKGAKTYVEDLFFGDKFDYQKRFTNKFVQKGNENESKSIVQLLKYLGLPIVVKNEKHFSNDYVKGTPDTIFQPLDFQLDMKNVFYPNGLDSFNDKLDHVYEWQAHCYNWLTEVNNGFVVKILTNPSEHILEKEAYILMKEAGISQMTESFFEDVRELYNFERLPIEDRLKIYHVQTEQKHIEQMIDAVELARDHFHTLNQQWETKNIENINIIKSLSQNVKH